jgi:hypothetical protein
MHFHLPKPLHGWRAFVGEVGIIVLGVLIALGAEQLVESLHWRREVATERASLMQEADDSFGTVAARAAQQPCVDKRLGEILTVLERHHRGEPLGIIGKVGAPLHETATRGTWQIALSGQALSHMSNKEKLQFSDIFVGFDRWDAAAKLEGDAWLRLAPLNHADLLSEEDWSGIRSAYADAVAINSVAGPAASFMLKKAKDQGFAHFSGTPIAAFSKISEQICQPFLATSGGEG